MSESVFTSVTRVSYVAGQIHDRLQGIGQPGAFADRLRTLAPIQGLKVTLPFGQYTPVDTRFWLRIADRQQVDLPLSTTVASNLRRSGIPLRHRASLIVPPPVALPRLELHVHPFGVMAICSADLRWSPNHPLGAVPAELADAEAKTASVTIGAETRQCPMREVASMAASWTVDLLGDAGVGTTRAIPAHRVTTVISGASSEPLEVLPTPNSALHLALHRLSAGGSIVAQPSSAFVAQWSGLGYEWPTTSLLYMLDRGSALLAKEAIETALGPEDEPTSERHRRNVLLVAYISALTGLILAADLSRPSYFREWANTAGKTLGRLFGPGSDYKDWGLMPRAYLTRTGMAEEVARKLGTPLIPNPNFPVTAYPGGTHGAVMPGN
jgi:hypothetical protein